jgi:hypothetical protein
MSPRGDRARSWWVAIVAAATLAACAGARNTPPQDLAYARWNTCEPHSGLAEISRVEPDGRIWFTFYLESERQSIVTCLAKAAQAGPTLPEPVAIVRGRGGA